MKQKELFDSLCPGLTADERVTGIMLMGSVARGIAAPNSDLDILVLGEDEKFITETIDGILVEYIYITPERARQKLMDSEIEVYHYLGSCIVYDKTGELEKLMSAAVCKYNHFAAAPKHKTQLFHWLLSVKIKLLSALAAEDAMQTNFITATNSWKIIEALWAVNDKPVPPSGSVRRFMGDITNVPVEDWFARLFTGDDNARVNYMLQMINWLLPKLDGKKTNPTTPKE